jgi:hypothetical protein
MRRRQLAAVLALTLSISVLSVASAAATPRSQDRTRPPIAPDDTLDVGDDYNGGRPLPFSGRVRAQLRRIGADSTSAMRVKVGDKKTWLGLDDAEGTAYLKDYKLRGIGTHIEVWVAADKDKVSKKLKFPKGDCRNGKRTRITKAQINYLIDEFDNNIYPKESDALSVPPTRNGTKATLDDQLDEANIPKNYWKGQGDNIVVLVDNVRDTNFYDTDNKHEFTYIAGFFASFFNEAVDRNIMTIDAFDWIHRTGANPPNNPAPGNPCKNAPARPQLYEGVFAHEYQHLLEYYEDPDEVSWVDEGLADWAATLTGYLDPDKPITDQDFESHIQCFLGNLIIETPANPSPDPGGPENSLTLWEDQVDDNESEILCDYGATHAMMEFLAGRYGQDFMSALHKEDAGGLEGLRAVLDTFAPDVEVLELLHQWAAMVALDGVLDDGAALSGGDPANYTTPTLDATINWDNPDAYDTPGAPPNGSDYVRLRDEGGTFLSASDIDSIDFDGSEELAPRPVRWRVDASPPKHKGNPALYSGRRPNQDRSIVRQVTVPSDNATLTFRTKYQIEELYDYGFVQVSTDGGETYTSLANQNTTSKHAPDAAPLVAENVPGFTGNSGGWKKQAFDLTDYAGQDVLVAFRYVTDPLVNRPGWWVDNIRVGGELISDGSSLEGWQSATQVNPVDVHGFTVQLVAYDEAHTQAHISTMSLDESFDGSLTGAALTGAIGSADSEVVAAIVTYDEPTESVEDYAPYVLTVNGVVQPGGS